MCPCVCVYVYAHVGVHMKTHVYVRARLYICVYVCAHMHVYMQTRAHTHSAYLCPHRYRYVCVHMYAWILYSFAEPGHPNKGAGETSGNKDALQPDRGGGYKTTHLSKSTDLYPRRGEFYCL